MNIIRYDRIYIHDYNISANYITLHWNDVRIFIQGTTYASSTYFLQIDVTYHFIV